ncbi:restriction endonuclease subunit S [Aquirufa antheringensis]|uniref:restriction endonuclease subunit S n=1 Tax=Aquirufa antheringensis TaxID=2516559 RepID=UPI001F8C293D|nr:restriction endonuclease subunit S [Pseudarcicella sp. GAP-15]
MSEWKESILGDIVEIIMGQSPKGETCNNNGIGFPLLNGPTEFTTSYPVPTQYTTDPKRFSEINDLLFCVRGSTTGKMNWSDQRYAIGRGIGAIRHRNGAILNPYIKGIIEYHLPILLQSATGSTFPNVSREQLSSLKIIVPDLPTQITIAEILSSLDDKIELNNKINKELETLAKAFFKHWFIDFEFPNENGDPYKSSGGEMVDSELGKIPKGWENSSLDKIANYLNGLALQKFLPENEFEFLPVIKIRELKQKDTQNSDRASLEIPEKYIVNNGDVLFSWSGSLMIDFWTNGKGALNQHLFKVTSDLFPKWFYYLWTKHHLNEFIGIAESKATTMGHIQRQHLSDAKVLIPQENYIKEFSLVFEPIISKIIDNRVESVELTNLRDSLIPKLITGEIKI